MKGKRNNKGFSMAEMMITVAILIVLAALAFVGVAQYRKSMHQLEMDAIAKEIFIASQNHLSTTESQGFLNLTPVSSGARDTSFGYKQTGEEGIYYFVYGEGADSDDPNNTDSLLSYMLPVGAVDETVRTGGSYIIRYQKSPALILDVFYTTRSGNYSHVFQATDLATCISLKGDDKKSERRDCFGADHAIMGWYGGNGVQSGPDLKAPSISIRNAEILEVLINDSNSASEYKHQLIIKGQTSGKTAILNYNPTDGKITLDDICVSTKHFANHTEFSELFPGENISVQAKVFSDSILTNVATSELKITNSLFDDATSVSGNKANAVISNIRHLENLSKAISGCGTTPANLYVEKALQTKNLTWSEFRQADSIKSYNPWAILVLDGSKTNPSEVLRPVVPANAIDYDGGFHSISGGTADNVVMNETTGNVGLFGTLSGGSVKNLELINFSVTGGASSNVGTLAGSASATIENVLVHHDATKSGTVTGGSGSLAGGLVGELLTGGKVEACAAAVRVSGGTAGGLVGESNGTVKGCYSAGHVRTEKSGEKVLFLEYITSPHYDVEGTAAAGGLIGNNSGAVSHSYSTCSVKSTTNCGGFVGKASSGGSISNSYCTGLVLPNGSQIGNAFVGNAVDGTGFTNNRFFMIINEVTKDGNIQYIEAGGYNANNSANSFDSTAAIYDSFLTNLYGTENAWTKAKPAAPYNDTLTTYYGGEYNLPTVAQLGAKISRNNGDIDIPVNYYVNTHYGDWPAPEIFVMNTPASSGSNSGNNNSGNNDNSNNGG